MKKALWIGFYGGLIMGTIGLIAVALDELIFMEQRFSNWQIIQFLILVSCSFIIKKFIIPNLFFE